MQQVLKALLPVILVIGLIVGARAFLKGKSEKAATTQKAATNQVALQVVQEKERTASNALSGFVIRPELHVAKTNVDQVGRYMAGLANAVVEAEKMKTNGALSVELQNAAAERTVKEFVPEAVRVLKEASDALPVARVEELKRLIVPRMPPTIAGLLTKGIEAVPSATSAGTFNVSPITHTREEVADYLFRLRDILTSINSELQSGKAFETQARASQRLGQQKRTIDDVDRTIREIGKSHWTHAELLAFRLSLSDDSGELNLARLTAGLTKEQRETVLAAVNSLYSRAGHTTLAPALASATKNTPSEVEAKLFEVLAAMKSVKEKHLALKAAGKEGTRDWNLAVNEQNCVHGAEIVAILVDLSEHAKENWTAKELSGFLERMRGTNGVDFGKLLDARCSTGDTIIPIVTRQGIGPIVSPLFGR